MRNLVKFETNNGKSEYFDEDDLYDVLDFYKITQNGSEMIGIVFGNKPGSYLLPYSEKNIDVLYRKMQAIESITANADGRTITIKYKSFTVTKDIKYKGYFEEIKKEQVRRGNIGCDEVTKLRFEVFGEYGKKPEYFVGKFSDVLCLEIVEEAGEPVIIAHFKDRLGFVPYRELTFGVLISKMKKIIDYKGFDLCSLRPKYADGTTYAPGSHSVTGFRSNFFCEQVYTINYYFYMGLYGNGKIEERYEQFSYVSDSYDDHVLNVGLNGGLFKSIFSSSPIKQIPIIGQKRGYFYYDIITDERIHRGITKDNSRKILTFGDHPCVSGRDVAADLRELSPDYIAAYKVALNNLKLSETPGTRPIMEIYKSLRYKEYEELMEKRKFEAKINANQGGRQDPQSEAEIKRVLRDLGSNGNR